MNNHFSFTGTLLNLAVTFRLLAGAGLDATAADPVPRQTTVRIVGEDFQINEDDHENFDQPESNFTASLREHVSWGWFDYRRKGESWDEGYQSPPVKWGLSSERKRAFFKFSAEITGTEISLATRAKPAALEEVRKPIRNFTLWKDTDGKPISCHDGGITTVGDTF